MKKYILLVSLMVTTLAFSQTKQNYNIGILLDNLTPELNPHILALQNEIKAVVGEDAIISFSDANILVNDFNLEKAASNYNTLLTNNTDIILAFGIINNMVLSKLKVYSKPTILFGEINKDLDKFEENKTTSGVSNFTYLVATQSLKKDLSTLKELTSFTTVGIAIEKRLVDVLPFKPIFDKETAALGVTYKIIPYDSSEDIVNAINDEIDAFYLASGYFLTNNDILKIADKLIEEKIPSITSTSIDDVERGLMATNQSKDNQDQFVRRIALSIEAYVNGQDFSELSVYVQTYDKLTINFNTAESVGMSMKYSLIARTDFVGDFVNVLSEKKYNLLDVMKTVVGENLNLQSSKKEIALSEQDVKTSKSDYYPSVIASASGTYVDPDLAAVSFGNSPEFSTAGAITLDQTLFSEAANANISIQKDLLDEKQAAA